MRFLFYLTFILSIMACTTSKKRSQAQKIENPKVEKSTQTSVKEDQSIETQVAKSEIWSKRSVDALPDLEYAINPTHFDLYYCDFDALIKRFKGDTIAIELPTLDGVITFKLQNSNTLTEALAAKYPTIKSYKGKSADGRQNIRLDTNEDGLFAEITSLDNKLLIRPILKGSTSYYAIYKEEDLPSVLSRDKTFE